MLCWLSVFKTSFKYLPIALCLLLSTSSSFRLRADSVSDLQLLAEVASWSNFLALLLDFSDSSILLLEILTVGSDSLVLLLVRVLQWEPAWSRSASESSKLWLSSELESWTGRLSMVLLLGVGELAVGVAWHMAGGCPTVFKETGFIVCVTTVVEETVTDSATLVRKAGVGVLVAWLSGVWAAEMSSEPGVTEAGVGGGAGAFLFLCWLSEPSPIW